MAAFGRLEARAMTITMSAIAHCRHWQSEAQQQQGPESAAENDGKLQLNAQALALLIAHIDPTLSKIQPY